MLFFLKQCTEHAQGGSSDHETGRLFEPAISYTIALWFDTKYYLKVVDEMVDLCWVLTR